ncbi:hypothetical protein [Facklamia miroungae]|uniref:Membrane domain of glycerophosphoryl diester phosphodiesterase n=1 Tax=Facklamia miroungae TaxID=120956 RepID=A0A1G7RSS4_9LACT|nr:hypothetical protein [Facklamia miroungae]NKZ29293.1 hypothetical protein [Facklamia miroungae]SDG13694.1 hypothetical protein SAMN05421791_103161 [Facklamia miroungae]
MFKEALKKFHKNYGYYLAVFLIPVFGFFLMNRLLNLVGATRINFFSIINQPIVFFNKIALDKLIDSVTNQIIGINGLLTLISTLFIAYLFIMLLRSIFLKLNFPATRIMESAYFKSSPKQAILLPLKLFFTQFSIFLASSLLWTGLNFIISQLFARNSFASFFVMVGVIVLTIITVPIAFLVAYDIEGNYNFLTTITKGLSIGLRHFWQIAKTILAQFLIVALITFVFVCIGIILVALFHSQTLIEIYIAFGIGFAVFWTFPFCIIYMAETMNKLFEKEY